MKTKLLLLITLCLSGLSFSQVQFWSDGFEDTGSPSSGSRTPSMSFYATNERYFDRVTPAQVNWTETLSGQQGAKFWGGVDIDNFTGPNTQSPSQSITWSSINISGKTGLSFSGLFAIGNTSNFDHFPGASPIDHMIVEYRIDGGAWTSLVRFFPNVANSGSGALALETTGDSLAQGEGAALNGTFSQFGANIAGTGTLLDLRFKCLSNGAIFEEIAIDNLRLFETASCTAPVIASNPPNRTICAGNNTTFTSSATGATAYQWQVNTGSGFTNISNGGVYSNATTTTLTITGAIPAMSGYLYRCVAINGVASCFTNSNAGTLTISNISTTGAQNNISCFGGSNGSAAVNASGGIAPYSYSWSPSGGTGSITTGLSANSYTVTVTDNIGCVATRNYTITQPPVALSASTGGGSTNVSCFGGSNGTATVSPTGGTAPYTYSWSPSGGTGATASGLSSGTYTVTVTDNNSCQTTRTFTVNQPSAALSASTGGGSTNVSCFGGSNGTATVSPTGGTAPYTYSWSPSGGTGATATGLASGTYTVTVTDNNSCQTTRTFTVNQPSAALSASSGGGSTNVSCFGGSNGTATVSPTGGTAPYTYSWSPSGGTGATATGLASGTYTVTVTDNNTCQTTRTFTVNQPSAALSASSGGGSTNVSCFGGSNGTATVSPTGGTAPYTYSWSPSGGTGATASGLASGTYTVTVTDNNTCQTTRTFTVNQPSAALSASSGGGSTNVSCFGGSNGTATVSPTGGTAPYTYSWSPSGGTGATATGLASGTYTVTVTDNNTCQTTRMFTVNQPSAALSASSGGGSTNVSCFGGSNGTATVSPTGGTAPYTYSWSPSGGTGATASGLSAGTYTVTVTDNNSCQTTRTFTLTEPSILSATATATDVSCFEGSNGTATVSPTGGTAPYAYSWSPSGGTGATASGLVSGTYTVTITDDNTCQTTQSITVNQPLEGLLLTATSTDASCDLPNGTATALVSGGTAPYSYSWSPSGGTGSTASGLSSGTYTVTVTDDNTCETSQSVTISDISGMDTEATSSMNVSCNGLTDGSATIGAVTGGTQPYTYDWSGNPIGNGTNSVSGLAPGLLTCTITDDNGCSIEVDFDISEPAVITGTDVQSACGSYTWANQTFTSSGQYMGVFQASNGCDSTVTLDLTIINIPTTTVTDNGDASITSSTADEYQWIDCATNMEIENATDQVFFPTMNGSYAVVAVYGSCVDTSDCVSIANVSITELGMNSWNIYPNPTNGIVNISSINDISDLQVFDLQGKQLFLKQIDDHTIDFSEYQSGIYVVKLIDGNGNVFIKRIEKLN